MKTLAYHEGIPGHHFQIAIQSELEGVPIFRTIGLFTAYIEGWALYTERLAWALADGLSTGRYAKCLRVDRSLESLTTDLIRMRRGSGQPWSQLTELAISVACEQADDWQNPGARPIDRKVAETCFRSILNSWPK